MKVIARFIGENGSMGLTTGETYTLMITGNSVRVQKTIAGNKFFTFVPYQSINAFFSNWTNINQIK